MNKNENNIKIDIDYFIIKKTNQNVLKDVHFEINKQDRVSFVGRSGCGKTTLMKAILGFIDSDQYDYQGEIMYKGQNLLDLNFENWRNFRGTHFRALYQEPIKMLHPLFKIKKQLQLNKNERINSIIKELKVEHTIDKYPNELSGGELQRIAIAQIIGEKSNFFFADEPSKSLDTSILEKFIELLKYNLNAKKIETLILISHNKNLIKKLQCNKIINLDKKKNLSFYNENETNMKFCNSGSEILKIKGLSFSYPIKKFLFPGKLQVLNNINISVSENEIIGILGNSGSGKSTFAKCLIGLNHNYSGKIEWNENNIKNKTLYSNIQYMNQKTAESFDPKQKIINNFKECFKGRNLDLNLAEDKVNNLLSRLKLTNDILEKYPNQLSGGEKQRLSFIRSLVGTKIFIADEIFVSLDSNLVNIVRQLINERVKKGNLTCIIISHNLQVLFSMTNRILVFNNGNIVEDQSTEDIITKPQKLITKELIKSAENLIIND